MSAHRSLDREAPHDVVPGVFRHRPLEHLGHAAHRTGRDRNPRRERLEQRDRSALVARGERDHVHGRIEPREVAAPAQPEHPALHPEPAGALPELSLPLPSAPHHEQPPGGTVHAAEPRAGVQHQLVVLDRTSHPTIPTTRSSGAIPSRAGPPRRKRVSSSPSGTTREPLRCGDLQPLGHLVPLRACEHDQAGGEAGKPALDLEKETGAERWEVVAPEYVAMERCGCKPARAHWRRRDVPACPLWPCGYGTMLARSARNRLLRSRSTDRSREGRTSRAIAGIIVGSTPRSRAYQHHVAHAALEVDGDQAGAEAVGFQPAREVHHVDGGPTHVQARGDPMDEEAVFRQSRSAFTIQRCGVLVMASGMRAVALRASTTILECSITLA